MEQRGENVASYCETSLLHEYKLDGLALKAVSGKEPDVTVVERVEGTGEHSSLERAIDRDPTVRVHCH